MNDLKDVLPRNTAAYDTYMIAHVKGPLKRLRRITWESIQPNEGYHALYKGRAFYKRTNAYIFGLILILLFS